MNDEAVAGHMARRFRGFLPVTIDVETGGFNCARDALLQIAAVIIDMDDSGQLIRGPTFSYHVKPFEGANIEAASLAVNRIDPWHPLRPAIDERDALQRIFKEVRTSMRLTGCTRAVLVGHNAWFDLSFLNAAIARCGRQAQPLPPVLEFRHRDPGRSRARADRAGQGRHDRRPRLGQRLGAFGDLRRRAHGRTVLHHLQ